MAGPRRPGSEGGEFPMTQSQVATVTQVATLLVRRAAAENRHRVSAKLTRATGVVVKGESPPREAWTQGLARPRRFADGKKEDLPLNSPCCRRTNWWRLARPR